MKTVIKKIWALAVFDGLKATICKGLKSIGYIPSPIWQSRLTFNGPVSIDTPVGKIKMIYTGKWIENTCFWNGFDSYEPLVLKAFMHEATNANLLLDIGANSGLFSLVAGLANPNAAIHAFEPSPTFFPLLKKNVLMNKIQAFTQQKAMGASPGTATLLSPPIGMGNAYASTLNQEHYSAHQTIQAVKTTVEVTTLLDYVIDAGISQIDLLKIDAEGFEVEILKPAIGHLKQWKTRLILEIISSENK